MTEQKEPNSEETEGVDEIDEDSPLPPKAQRAANIARQMEKEFGEALAEGMEENLPDKDDE